MCHEEVDKEKEEGKSLRIFEYKALTKPWRFIDTYASTCEFSKM